MIRKAQHDEIDAIISVTRACAAFMTSRGIYQWNEHYPNKNAFLKDVDRGELFVVLKDNQIIGCIVISSIKDDEYDEIDWLTPDSGNIYIHRLAVHPEYQGMGYARRMMDFAESLALKSGAPSIRLDTFSMNKRNQRFYETRGYTRLGDIYFPLQSPYPFHCYELPLQPHRTSEKYPE